MKVGGKHLRLVFTPYPISLQAIACRPFAYKFIITFFPFTMLMPRFGWLSRRPLRS